MDHVRQRAVSDPRGHLIRSRFDLAVAILLGLTVMAIAWGAYRAEVKGNEADHYFNRSDETLGTAQKVGLQGDQEVSIDEQLFLELERDQAVGNVKVVAIVRRRLETRAVARAIAWWQRQPSSRRPPSPFVAANPLYRNVYYERSAALEATAAQYLDTAHRAEQRRIDYTIVSVILTVALFVLGISTQIVVDPVKFGLVVFAGLVLLGSIGRFVDLGL